jgi:putative oxidoreductase
MKKTMNGVKPLSIDLGLLLLRIAAGGLMLINHGWPKIINFADKADRFADPFGIGSTPSLILVIFAEFFCSSLLVLGLLTRYSLIPLIITMVVAAFVVHAGDPFREIESALFFLISYVALFFTGPGKYSADHIR